MKINIESMIVKLRILYLTQANANTIPDLKRISKIVKYQALEIFTKKKKKLTVMNEKKHRPSCHRIVNYFIETQVQ